MKTANVVFGFFVVSYFACQTNVFTDPQNLIKFLRKFNHREGAFTSTLCDLIKNFNKVVETLIKKNPVYELLDPKTTFTEAIQGSSKFSCWTKEERTQKELKTIETKTQNIIQIIDEQAVKMAKLYSDEAEVKQAIKIVLKEEQDVIMQIAQLTASMEIQSDIAIEYAAFSNALNLIPHMLHEIEESLLAVTNQAIYPSLLPSESILKTIPFYSKQLALL